jgi:response regulator RpfG family c-di-GMP phosphodiesterase
MKSIKGKLYIVYILILVALSATVFSSYIAVDTGKQHRMLTELLATQAEHVDKVILVTEELAYMRLADSDLFTARKPVLKETLLEGFEQVEAALRAFEREEYFYDGKLEKLKFEGEFRIEFLDAVYFAQDTWSKAQDDINDLLYSDVDASYTEKLSYFESMNVMLVQNVDRITQLCRDEAERQKRYANVLQAVSLVMAGFIFMWLIYFIRRDIQLPIYKIRDTFEKMGSGDFSVRLDATNNDEFQKLYNDFNHFVDNHNTIRHIEDHILSEDNLRTVLIEMLEDFKGFVPLTRISIAYTDSFKNYFMIHSNAVFEEKMETLDVYDEIICKDDVNLIMPIVVNNAYLGYAVFQKRTKFTDKDVKFVSGLKQKISFAFYKSLMFKDLLRIVTNALADLTESRDPETRRHLTRMSLYSRIIAAKLYDDGKYPEIIDGEFVENIQLTAPMHDIGKVAVPDSILLKPGKLTDEEFEIMKTHTCEGAKVMSVIHEKFSVYNIQYFKMAADIAHFHQEKYNGSGYPEAISGKEIPLAARICSVADVFDALTSKRPYKDAFPLEKSYNIIKESSGTHFDPELVDVFFKCQEEIEAVYYKYREV